MNEPDRSGLSQAGVPRRRVLTGFAGVGLAAGASGLLAACSSGGGSSSAPAASSSAATGKPTYGGNMQVGLTGGSSSDTLDPHGAVTDLDISRVQTIYEPLVALDSDGAKVVYQLAESITPQKAGSFTDWVIKLRSGVTFHDGKALTADDVLFTINRIFTLNKTGTAGKIFMGPVDLKQTKKIDTLTVLIVLTSPIAGYPEQLAAAPFNVLIAPATLNPAKPNGTGAFKYKSFTPGQRSVFVKNPHYWQSGLPYADTLTIIDFPDTTSLADALTTGQIQGAGTLDPPQIPALDNADGVHVVISKSGSIIPFTMRVDQAPFKDYRVRQAMRLLVDRPQLINSALDGYGTVANDVFSPFDPDFDKSLVRQQDIPQAKSLLKAAGQEKLTVTLVTSPVLTGVVACATVFAQQAKAAGVTVNLKNVPTGTFFGSGYLQSTFSQDYYSYFPYLAQVSQSMLKASPYNETHTDDPTYTKLYNQANSAATDALRKEAIQKMQEFDFQKGGYIIPAYTDTLDAYSNKITGYTTSKTGQPLSGYGFARFAFTK